MNDETDRLLSNLATFRHYGKAVPAHLHNGLAAYVAEHQKPGHFLTAVLENDLRAAVGHADSDSLAGIGAVSAWLYNEPPSGCYGSQKNVREWLAVGRVDDVLERGSFN